MSGSGADITGLMVLPPDVVVAPVASLAADVRAALTGRGDFAITRPGARASSKLVDRDGAELLEAFRTPTTVIDAVVAFSEARGLDPRETLTGAFPMIKDCCNALFLVPADSPEASSFNPMFERDDVVAGFTVARPVQCLQDTELYQAKTPTGEWVSLKILRPGAPASKAREVTREAEMLRRVTDGTVPRVLQQGVHDGRAFTAMEWRHGASPLVAAAEIRGDSGSLRVLCAAVVEAFARLHDVGIVHGDVHPGNVLVAKDGTVTILDLGSAHAQGGGKEMSRAGVARFFEPELAAARRSGRASPAASAPGEQYALGAMLYQMITGQHYIDFALEVDEAMRQIQTVKPLPFTRRGTAAWPEMERALGRALEKDPTRRFSSLSEFADAIRNSALPTTEDRAAAALTARADALVEELLAAVSLDGPLLRTGLDHGPRSSVHGGAAGIGFALYRMAMVREEADLLALADVWMSRAEAWMDHPNAFYWGTMTPELLGRTSLYHTAPGVHLARASLSDVVGDSSGCMRAIQSFLEVSAQAQDGPDLALGAVGLLLGHALLLERFPAHGPVTTTVHSLRESGGRIARSVWDRLDRMPEVGSPDGLANLGMAHGWAGALYTILRWHRAAGAEVPSRLESRLAELTERAVAAGRGLRWQWTTGSTGGHAGAGMGSSWCNGSSGFVHLWTQALAFYGDPAYLDLARAAAWNVLDEPNPLSFLCCGAAGSAFAMLELYRHTGDTVWLDHARRFEADAVRIELEEPRGSRNLHGLYRGRLGVGLLVTEMLDPEGASMPLFGEEGWPRVEAPATTHQQRP